MAAVTSNGSPELRRRASTQFIIHEEVDNDQGTMMTARHASSVSK